MMQCVCQTLDALLIQCTPLCWLYWLFFRLTLPPLPHCPTLAQLAFFKHSSLLTASSPAPPPPPHPFPFHPCPPVSGGSVANCYNDLWVLDLSTGAWTKPEVVGGSPTPRAGHGGALVGDSWYILGGGNNVKGGWRLIACWARGFLACECWGVALGVRTPFRHVHQ